MDRLSLMLTPMTGAVITGGLVILMFVLGFYSWVAIWIAAGIGLLAAWPAAYVVSRRIKDSDRFWQRRRAQQAGFLPEV